MGKQQLTPVGALALEMALHDEQERRALGSELEAAWRQAEEIAGIGDRLPDLPVSEPPRIPVAY
jgi:3-deoxy-D-manno-octulosonate 8-phosphate phosphatase KdsC-like HAD superfamily phosphatase